MLLLFLLVNRSFTHTKLHSAAKVGGTNSNENGAGAPRCGKIGLKGRQLQSTVGGVADCLLGLKPAYKTV